ANVTESSRETTNGVEYRFRVIAAPGQEVRVTEIVVRGNTDVGTGFIESRVSVKPDSIYDGRDVRQSFRRLYATGLFRTVDVKLEGDGPERRLVVEVTEAPTLEYYYEVGFGAYDLLRGLVGVRERNLFGTELIGRAELTGSFRGAEALVGVTDPWFLR